MKTYLGVDGSTLTCLKNEFLDTASHQWLYHDGMITNCFSREALSFEGEDTIRMTPENYGDTNQQWIFTTTGYIVPKKDTNLTLAISSLNKDEAVIKLLRFRKGENIKKTRFYYHIILDWDESMPDSREYPSRMKFVYAPQSKNRTDVDKFESKKPSANVLHRPIVEIVKQQRSTTEEFQNLVDTVEGNTSDVHGNDIPKAKVVQCISSEFTSKPMCDMVEHPETSMQVPGVVSQIEIESMSVSKTRSLHQPKFSSIHVDIVESIIEDDSPSFIAEHGMTDVQNFENSELLESTEDSLDIKDAIGMLESVDSQSRVESWILAVQSQAPDEMGEVAETFADALDSQLPYTETTVLEPYPEVVTAVADKISAHTIAETPMEAVVKGTKAHSDGGSTIIIHSSGGCPDLANNPAKEKRYIVTPIDEDITIEVAEGLQDNCGVVGDTKDFMEATEDSNKCPVTVAEEDDATTLTSLTEEISLMTRDSSMGLEVVPEEMEIMIEDMAFPFKEFSKQVPRESVDPMAGGDYGRVCAQNVNDEILSPNISVVDEAPEEAVIIKMSSEEIVMPCFERRIFQTVNSSVNSVAWEHTSKWNHLQDDVSRQLITEKEHGGPVQISYSLSIMADKQEPLSDVLLGKTSDVQSWANKQDTICFVDSFGCFDTVDLQTAELTNSNKIYCVVHDVSLLHDEIASKFDKLSEDKIIKTDKNDEKRYCKTYVKPCSSEKLHLNSTITKEFQDCKNHLNNTIFAIKGKMDDISCENCTLIPILKTEMLEHFQIHSHLEVAKPVVAKPSVSTTAGHFLHLIDYAFRDNQTEIQIETRNTEKLNVATRAIENIVKTRLELEQGNGLGLISSANTNTLERKPAMTRLSESNKFLECAKSLPEVSTSMLHIESGLKKPEMEFAFSKSSTCAAKDSLNFSQYAQSSVNRDKTSLDSFDFAQHHAKEISKPSSESVYKAEQGFATCGQNYITAKSQETMAELKVSQNETEICSSVQLPNMFDMYTHPEHGLRICWDHDENADDPKNELALDIKDFKGNSVVVRKVALSRGELIIEKSSLTPGTSYSVEMLAFGAADGVDLNSSGELSDLSVQSTNGGSTEGCGPRRLSRCLLTFPPDPPLDVSSTPTGKKGRSRLRWRHPGGRHDEYHLSFHNAAGDPLASFKVAGDAESFAIDDAVAKQLRRNMEMGGGDGFVSNDVQKDKVTVSLKTVANGVSIFDMSREKLEKTASVASIPVEMEISLQDLDKSTSSSSDVKWAWGWTLVSWLGVVGVLASAAALYHSVAQEDIARKDWKSAGKVVIKVPIKPRRD